MYWKTRICPILLMLGCSLAGGVVLDRPLKTEQELRISGYDASKMKISGNEQEKYLEITLKKNEGVRFYWQLGNAQELSGKCVEVSFEIAMDGENRPGTEAAHLSSGPRARIRNSSAGKSCAFQRKTGNGPGFPGSCFFPFRSALSVSHLSSKE